MSVRVDQIWRYPVKSLGGETLPSARVDFGGVDGDRLVHVGEPSGRVVTARYRPALLGLKATLGRDGEPLVDGDAWTSPAVLEAVRRASSSDVELVRFAAPDRGQRHDVLPLTVLTDGMVDAIGLDFRRFRPNILVEGVHGMSEREWVGHALRVGSALIGVRKARPRCVITTFDPDTLEQDSSVLRRIVTELDGRIALDCWVLEPGEISAGDTVDVVPMPAGVELPAGNAAR